MDLHGARRCGEEALALTTGDDDELMGPILSLAANGGAIDGDLEQAHALQVRSQELWKPNTRLQELANHLAMMSLTSYWMGRHDEAIEQGRRSYEMAAEQRSAGTLLQGGSHLAMALAASGRHDEALELFEKVVIQGRELEAKPRLTARTLNMMAAALREVGEGAEARLRNEEGIECAESADFAAAKSQGHIDLVFAAITDGEIGEALQRWEQVQQQVESLAGWHRWLGRSRLAQARAEIELASGDMAAAAEAATESLRQAEAVGRRKYAVLGRATLGTALAACGQPDAAIVDLQLASAGATELGHPPTIWRVESALAAVLAGAGRESEANGVAQAALSTIDSFAASLSPLRRDRFLAAPSTTNLRAALART